jgi:AcrR family transcriptional regulator
VTSEARRSERDAIIRAAHRLIGHGDESLTSIETILRAARVNRRVFYRHFASKDDLFIAMQDQAGELILSDLRSAVDGADSPAAAMVAWIEHYLSIGWDPARFRDARTFLTAEVALARGSAAALEVTYARHRQLLADVLADGLADGTLSNARPSLDAFAIHAIAVRHIEARIRGWADLSYGEVRDQVVALFMTALATPALETGDALPSGAPRV